MAKVELKAPVVAEISEAIKDAQSVVLVDYRGLIEKLDTAMDLYSGAGLENFDSGDLKGVVVDVMSSVAGLREAYTRLTELFADLKNPRDTEEVEVFLADDKKRENFYNLLCALGKALNIVLNAEQTYAAVPKDELKQYQNTFIFFSKVRRSVKIRYCDAIDNRDAKSFGYAPLRSWSETDHQPHRYSEQG